uniref:ATP synthase subunit a n=1 Tax=Ricania speculum TaxID=1902407 RepID=A0A1C9JBZ7_9HEMI|nr:ATP synthase F0 subunit 6 [Ricania speculum]AOP19361.1 ATP synthase F0 subunit 6 [Ricania speculum]QNV47327.1 ATP synthase F0 subunit 6 [Ricania speculum]
MTSLFSSFDPSTSIYQMNWMMMLSTMIIMPMNFWLKKSRVNMIKKKLENKMNEEFYNATHHKEMILMSTSLFFVISINNIMGIFPYNFTGTSHMAVSMSMALPMWLMFMIYGWTKFTNELFKHLLPTGTPSPIMPMMIIIETTGNIIRPISLSVRLTANMIAGHLLMTLLGNMNEMKMLTLILPMQIGLTMFESAIAFIQAYVFSTLITLYSSEIP